MVCLQFVRHAAARSVHVCCCCLLPPTPFNGPPLPFGSQPLSVELGPGIMGNIFDGIQRPLKQIALDSASCFIPRGVDVPALDRSLQWEFEPTQF